MWESTKGNNRALRRVTTFDERINALLRKVSEILLRSHQTDIMKYIKKLLTLVAAIVLLTGCKSSNLTYFSDLSAMEGVLSISKSEIKIEPEDELLINVSSDIPEATAPYNLPFNSSLRSTEMLSNSVASQKQTYIVDKNGNINFPLLGKIHVEGMTTLQLAEELTRRIAVDVEAPLVRVQLLNFNVNVMGEVMNPGRYRSENERLTVLDALALAGDMTVFGKRDGVTVLREENGAITYHRLNLNDSKISTSPYFYLKQNDVVYVEPSEARAGQADYNQNNSFKVSVISAIVSGVSVITSLVIALVINK